VLGVPPGASAEEIRATYRALARQLHPDAHGGAASPAMAAVNAAWFVLRDPARRAVYDASLRPAASSRSVPPPTTTDTEIDDDDTVAYDGARHPLGRWGIPLPWMLVLGVLGLIFVFTAYAASAHHGNRPDGVLQVGSCVRLSAAGWADEVACDGARDGTVVSLKASQSTCPAQTETWHDRQSVQLVCVRRR
jgi:molecular chaperone DnaJ